MAETIQNSGMSLQPKEKQKQGTGYTNIQRVLGANVGSKLGSAVKTGIQQQAQGVQQQTQQAKSQFEMGVAQGRLDTDEAKAAREAAIKRLSGPGYTGPSEEEIQQFSKFRSGQYSGPKSIENEQELLSKAADVSGMARGLGTAEGRQGILQQYVGQSPSYSAGKSAIDQLLLGRSAEDIKAARAAAMGLGRNTYQNIASAREAGKAAERSSAAFGQETAQRLAQEQNLLDETITREMEDAQRAESRRVGELQKIINQMSSSGNVKQATRGATGIDAQLSALEKAGLLGQNELTNLKQTVSGIQQAQNKARNDYFINVLNNKIQSAAKNNNSKQVKELNKIKNDPVALQSWINSQDQSSFDRNFSTLSENELGSIVSKLINPGQAYGLDQKTSFIDQQEAAKFSALAKLAGKDALYQNIPEEAAYRAGSAGFEANRASNISNLASKLSPIIQQYGAVSGTGSQQTTARKNAMNEYQKILQALRGYM